MAKAGQVGTADGSKFVWVKKGNTLTRDFRKAAVEKATGGGTKKTASPTKKTTRVTTRSSSAPSTSVRPPKNPRRSSSAAPTETVRPPKNPRRGSSVKSTTKASGVGNYSKAANAAAPTSSVKPKVRPEGGTTTRTVKSGVPGKRVTKRTVKSGERGGSSAKGHSYDEVPAARKKTTAAPKTRLASTAKGGPRSSSTSTNASARAKAEAARKRADNLRKQLETKTNKRNAEAKRRVDRRSDSLKPSSAKVTPKYSSDLKSFARFDPREFLPKAMIDRATKRVRNQMGSNTSAVGKRVPGRALWEAIFENESTSVIKERYKKHRKDNSNYKRSSGAG